jgi:hypothetical protein
MDIKKLFSFLKIDTVDKLKEEYLSKFSVDFPLINAYIIKR